MWRIAVVIGCFGLGAMPAFGQNKAAIQQLNDAWTAAFNKGDGAAVADMYTEDACVLPPAPTSSRAARRSKPSGSRRFSDWATPN